MTEGARDVVVFPDLDAVSHEAARRFVALANDAVERTHRFTVALAGGSTPERLYRLLASDQYRDAVPWASVYVFFGDERCVPPDDAESNYRMARAALLDHVPLIPEQVFRMEGRARSAERGDDLRRDPRRCLRPDAGAHPAVRSHPARDGAGRSYCLALPAY